MGEVYRARDTRLGREVAVKVLSEHLASSPEDRARFQREAKTISSLNHPNICTLHDVGREGDTDYLVMELVEGETLAQRLSRGPLPTAEVLRIGSQIADALDRAHRAGVVHRDLKPGNVMLTRGGAKLMDFGLARPVRPVVEGVGDGVTASAGRAGGPITGAGRVVGTFQYMAPEQLEGGRVDGRSDIWALGCVLYEMATGRRAFEGSTAVSLISAILRDEPRRMGELAPLTPPALERVVRLCLEKDGEERWQSAGDLRRELLWIGEVGSQAGVPAPVVAQRRVRERAAWVLVGVTVIVAVGLGVLLWRAKGAQARHVTFRPLTFKPMLVYRAAFAPDGKTVVLGAGVGGIEPRVYVIRPEYPEPQAVSDPNTELLSVSSKGELAVLTHAEQPRRANRFLGTLARMPLGGGAPREILEGVEEADWSPDGTHLAVLRKVQGKDELEYPIGHVLSGAGHALSDIRVSPQGDKIAYCEHPDRYEVGGSIDVIDVRGRKRVLSRGYTNIGGVAWSPDGRGVYFSGVDSTSQTAQVFRLSLTGERRYVMTSAGGVDIKDASRDGRFLVTREEWRHAVMVHKPEWKEDRDLSWLDGASYGRLSGDGKLIAFTEYSSAFGGKPVMCLRKTDGSPVVKLGVGRVWDLSKDGTKVLARIPTDPPQVVVQPTGPGEVSRLPRGPIETYLLGVFSPGGDSVGFMGSEKGKGTQIFIQGLSGSPPRPISPEGVLFAAISPDWRRFAINGFDRPWTLYSAAGRQLGLLPVLTADDDPVLWNADGRSILVQDSHRAPGFIQKVDIATGRRTPFMKLRPPDREGLVGLTVTSFTADGRCCSYQAAWVTSTLFLVEPGR